MVSHNPPPPRPPANPLAGCAKDLGSYHHVLFKLAGPASQCRTDELHDGYSAETHLDAGAAAMQNGLLAEAAGAFRRALAADPRCAEAYGGLAMVYQQSREYPAALEMYLKCLELDGDNLIALLGLFQTSCRMGSFARIIHCMQVYLRSHPDDASVLFCLGSLYAREGRFLEAGNALRRVLALNPENTEAVELMAKVRSVAGPAAT